MSFKSCNIDSAKSVIKSLWGKIPNDPGGKFLDCWNLT